ncbi:MAG: hypothetical protein J2O48_09425 [Solirubrobacterales bacterium]|nr:hypothetical protein [Solirubrobacterales bacterium]
MPSNVAFYISGVVKPDSSQVGAIKQIVTEFGGTAAWTKLNAGLQRGLARISPSFTKNVLPQVGQRVGFAFTKFVPSEFQSANGGMPADAAVVIPSSNPSKLQQAIKQTHSSGGGVTAVDGGDLLVGGPAAVNAIKSNHGPTLTGNSAYKSLAAPEALGSGFVNMHEFISGMQSSPQAGQAFQSPALQAELKKLPNDAAAGMSLTATGKAITLDFAPYHVPSASASAAKASTVAGLPSSSILALALNISQKSLQTMSKNALNNLSSGLSQSSAMTGGGLAAATQKLTQISKTILPALGPLQLSIGGSSFLKPQVGLSMTPYNQKAADNLLGLLRKQITSSAGANVHVTPAKGGFALSAPPSYNATVTHTGNQILGLMGFQNANAFLHSGSPLSSDSTYKTATSQLPGGSKVPVFLNFGNLKKLVTQLFQLQGKSNDPSTIKTEAILGHLNYLILGLSGSSDRLVLGLN